MVQCRICGNKMEGELDNVETLSYYAFDRQKNEIRPFCSKGCLRSWAIRKIIGMSIAIILGLAIVIGSIIGDSLEMMVLFFVPYMIREKRTVAFGILEGNIVEAVISLLIIYLGSVTVIYPLVRLIQEVRLYSNILKDTAED